MESRQPRRRFERRAARLGVRAGPGSRGTLFAVGDMVVLWLPQAVRPPSGRSVVWVSGNALLAPAKKERAGFFQQLEPQTGLLGLASPHKARQCGRVIRLASELGSRQAGGFPLAHGLVGHTAALGYGLQAFFGDELGKNLHPAAKGSTCCPFCASTGSSRRW